MLDINYIFAQSLFDFLPEKSVDQDIVFLMLVAGAAVAAGIAYLINRFVDKFFIRLAHIVSAREEAKTKGEKILQVRRTETLLSVFAAIVRSAVFAACLYAAWRLINPTSAPLALIGASTVFIVLGAATIGPLLRDYTNGILMIVERWYNVGDHIVVDPFWDLSGVVEKINLRSTKLRSLNGQIVWVHNQHIHGVRVTPKGVRTTSIDLFVNDIDAAKKMIARVVRNLPTGPTMISKALTVTEEEKLGNIWRITLTGQTSPGREWLIEDFAVGVFVQADERRGKNKQVLVYKPAVRYTDPAAEKRFMRSMNARKPL